MARIYQLDTSKNRGTTPSLRRGKIIDFLADERVAARDEFFNYTTYLQEIYFQTGNFEHVDFHHYTFLHDRWKTLNPSLRA